MTVRQHLITALTDVALKHGPEEVPPAALLWTDKDGQWESMIPTLRADLPGLLTLGSYDEPQSTGPAIWIRCKIAGTLNGPAPSPSLVYLPKVSRMDLKDSEACPRFLQPLIELQFRGVHWTHPNGKDWTPVAFLLQLGLDVASDEATRGAVKERLPRILDTDLEELQSLGRLDGHKVRNLGSDWPSDLLAWMQSPATRYSTEQAGDWNLFRSACQASYGFDPESDGELAAAERLAEANGAWRAVWMRFFHAAKRYPNVVALLKQVSPPDLFGRVEGYPTLNADAEAQLRDEFTKLSKRDPGTARKRIIELEAEHKARRNWVWCELGDSPMAVALGYLASCSDKTSVALTATSVEELIFKYSKSGYEADMRAWQAYASVDTLSDIKLIGSLVRVIYLPWLEAAALTFAKLCEKSPLLSLWAPTPMPEEGECILFADGLRFDVAKLLQDELAEQGAKVEFSHKVCALPSVTPTAKPAVSPISDKFSGNGSGADFRPVVSASGTVLQPEKFKALLAESGVAPLGFDDFGDSTAKGWTEAGKLDSMGHSEGARLARRIPEEVKVLSDRIRSLLDSGWKKVRVVTDHGWLWMPGGLPKTDLPAYLAESRWGRCASLKELATTDLQVVPWHWQQSVSIVLPTGISCFKKGHEYAHGGLSVQECVVPVLVVTSAVEVISARILEIKWVGLKCAIKLSGANGLVADIRTKAADASSSILVAKKKVDHDSVSVFADDAYEGVASLVVLVDETGRVVAKSQTTVGGI